ncbi:MAG: protein kinase [Deltaproteobacteria bacterium]|nr:protein kinase [Deltaproteobacteria bacterium]
METRPQNLTFGRFRARRVLARTEYADVFEASDDEGQPFALKALRVERVDPALVDALFQREIAALDGFEHDGIVTLRASHREADGTPILVFDLVPGNLTLERLLTQAQEGLQARSVSWRITEALRLVSAVSAAHARRVIHRDLKPANVLVDTDSDHLTICDFGVANVLHYRALNPEGRTLRDLFTRPYAAPEQCLHGEALYPADVHALSLLVLALLSMRRPHDGFGLSDFRDLWSVAARDLTSSGAPTGVLAPLEATLRAGLASEPSQRPTLHALTADLQAVSDAITPRPTAVLRLTRTATQKLQEFDATPAQLAADLNAALTLRIDEGTTGSRVKMYGETWMAVAVWDPGGEVRVIDVLLLSGPRLANDRREARKALVQVQFGTGDGSPLVEAALSARSHAQSERVEKLLSLAQRVIALERERLPRVEFKGHVTNGTPLEKDRVRVRQASIEVTDVRWVTPPGAQIEAVELSPLDAARVPGHFPTIEAMQVLNPESCHGLGRCTGWNVGTNGRVIATVDFDRTHERHRRVTLHLQDQLRRRELDKQEEALDRLRGKKSWIPELGRLLTQTSTHALAARAAVTPFQGFLRGDRRVCDILERVLACDVSCVQGPPGTGKTTLLVELVMQLLTQNPRQRILICSQSNEAVSNAIERLQEPDLAQHLHTPPWVVRDVRDELRNEARHDGLEPMFRRMARGWREAVKAQRAVHAGPRGDALDEWCRDLEHAAAGSREEFSAHVQVWGSTTSRSQRSLKLARSDRWDVVIVDEAAKITLAEVLVPLVSARKIILVGDHKQLPPYLDSLTAELLDAQGLDPEEAKLSLFQHLFERVLPETHRGEMRTQSRMHPTIGHLVSTLFYEGKLLHNVRHEDRPLPPGRFDRPHRALFLGFRGSDQATAEGSRRNADEAEQVVRLLCALDAETGAARRTLTVSVITPYRAQAELLDAKVRRNWMSLRDVRAGTVNTFQGRQSDVIVYSLVRTGSTEWRFLADPRLFNVALSRARSLLLLVGDLDGAPATPLLQRLLALLPDENKVPLQRFLTA